MKWDMKNLRPSHFREFVFLSFCSALELRNFSDVHNCNLISASRTSFRLLSFSVIDIFSCRWWEWLIANLRNSPERGTAVGHYAACLAINRSCFWVSELQIQASGPIRPFSVSDQVLTPESGYSRDYQRRSNSIWLTDNTFHFAIRCHFQTQWGCEQVATSDQ